MIDTVNFKKYFGSIEVNTIVGIPSGYTPETDAFILAVKSGGDTLTSTEINAVDQLVLDLQAASIWTTMGYLYPFVGGTSTSMKWNLRDTTTAQITWYGDMTFSSQGILGNASNSGGDSGLNPVTLSYNQMAMGGYLNNVSASVDPASGWYDFGMYDATTTSDVMLSWGWKHVGEKWTNFTSFPPGDYTKLIGGGTSYTGSVVYGQNSGGSPGNQDIVEGSQVFFSPAAYIDLSTENVGVGCSWRGSVYGSTGRGFGLAFAANDYYNLTERTALDNAITTFVTSLSRE